MTPERWQQIEKLFHAALEHEGDQRTSFLDQACAGNEELRREVESLLVSHEQGRSLFEEPALEVAARVVAEGHGPSWVGRQTRLLQDSLSAGRGRHGRSLSSQRHAAWAGGGG